MMTSCHICGWKDRDTGDVIQCDFCRDAVCLSCSDGAICERCLEKIEYLESTIKSFALIYREIVSAWYERKGK